MKQILTTLAVLFSLIVVAQKNSAATSERTPYDETFAQLHYWEYKLNSSLDTQTIKTHINKELYLSQNDELRVVAIKQSLTATHITFKQFYQGVEVLGGGAKVAVSKNNVLFRCIETLFPTSNSMPVLPNDLDIQSRLSSKAQLQVLESKPVYAWDGQRLVGAWYAHYLHDEIGDSESVWLGNGDLYLSRDLNRYYAGPDSTVTMKVFQPDPITPISQVYGGIYVDLNDGNAATLDPLRKTVQMKARFDSGYFHLKSDYVEIIEHSSPVKPIVKVTQPEFSFSRSDDNFEQVNAYYHIMNFQNYVQSLGYDIADYAIHVDANGFGGADNSAYTPSTNPPRLTFGEGGVDDAEDADVVVHEYGHALSDDVSPLTNTGIERRTLDEALGDYFAVTYTKEDFAFGSYKVFNWDGHNPFWQGRTVNNPDNLCYDNVTFTFIYANTTLWNGAMFDLWNQLGKAYTDKLQIETMYGYFQNMSFRDAALMVIDADSALSGGVNEIAIWQAFDQYCILDWSDINDSRLTESVPYIIKRNTLQKGQSVLIELETVKTSSNYNYSLMSANGQILSENKLVEGENAIPMNYSAAGIYLLRLEINGRIYTERIVLL